MKLEAVNQLTTLIGMGSNHNEPSRTTARIFWLGTEGKIKRPKKRKVLGELWGP